MKRMSNNTNKLTSLLRKLDADPTISCPHVLSDSCSGCEFNISDDKCDTFARKAAYLISNGVFAPPCKVGDEVFLVLEDKMQEGGIYVTDAHKVTKVGSKGFWLSVYYTPKDDMSDFIPWDELGKTAFLSKEEAEDVVRKKRESESHKSWLRTCPCNDCNFKIHLKAAKTEDIQSVLQELPEEGNKTKIKVLKAELNKRLKIGK